MQKPKHKAQHQRGLYILTNIYHTHT